MNLKDLIKKHTFEKIKPRLIKLYPDQRKNIEGYESVYQKLQKIKAKKTDFKILIERVKEKEGNWISISGKKRWAKWLYAIEFTPWKEWLGAEFTRKTKKDFSEIDIICHCLWEMTWSGFTEQEIWKDIKEINRRVEEVKSGKAKLIPWEEVKTQLKDAQ